MKEALETINNLFPLAEKGGIVMWPIAILSMFALAIILERFWVLVLRADRIMSKAFMREIEAMLDKGEIEETVVACRKRDSMMSRVLLAGLALRGAPRGIIREALEDEGRKEARELERYLGGLAAIAGVSPLLGLLGTVFGMIEIFQKIESNPVGKFESLAGGIYVALYTTAAGLVVAIPTYLAYRAFLGIATYRTNEMEEQAVSLLNHLDRPGGVFNGGPAEEQDEV